MHFAYQDQCVVTTRQGVWNVSETRGLRLQAVPRVRFRVWGLRQLTGEVSYRVRVNLWSRDGDSWQFPGLLLPSLSPRYSEMFNTFKVPFWEQNKSIWHLTANKPTGCRVVQNLYSFVSSQN